MTGRRGTPAGWVILGLSLVAIVAGIVFEQQSPLLPDEDPVRWIDYLWGFSFFGFPLVGALIVSSDRRNPIGWLLLSVGFFLGFGLAATEYPDFAYLAREQALPGRVAVAWFSSWLLAPAFGALPLLLVVFPTGRLENRLVRSLATAVIAAVLVMISAGALMPGPMDGVAGLDNPLGVKIVARPLKFLMTLVGPVIGLVAVLAVGRLLVLLRRSSGEQRAQIKWFVHAVTTAIAIFGALIALETFGLVVETIGVLAFIAALNGVAASLGIAVLKYRLYDIDVVISKTVVFAGLAGFITAIYVSIVVGMGTLLGAGGEPNLALSIVATGVVAVAFQPVRERLTRLANRLVFGQRATPYEVLSRFSEHLGEVAAPERTLERMAKLLADGTGAARAQVWLRTGGELRPAATWPVHMTDDAQPDHLVDVVHEGELLGALSLDKQRGETLTPTDQKLVDDLAAQAGLVLRNLRLTEELKAKIVDLQASRQRLVAAQDAERRRLERDLHDGAQRQLLELKSQLAAASSTAAGEQAVKAAQILEQVAGDADDAVATLRELAHGIFPPLLAAEGLAGALTAQASKAAVPVEVEPDGIGRYPQDVEAAVYFCVLEAINNAAKYANPTQVTIRLTEHDGQLTFEVSDDGAGFDPATTPRGHGTTNMTDRLDALDGHLKIDSRPGMGTRVRGSLAAGTPVVMK